LGWTVAKYFSLQFNGDFSISSSVAFNQQDLENFLHSAVPLGIYFGGGGLMLACLLALLKVLTAFRLSKARKMMDIMTVLMYSAVGAAMFGLSLPVFTAQLDRPTYERVPQIFKAWDRTLDRFQLTSSYGLFRRMTGVDGRPEIIIGRNFCSMKMCRLACISDSIAILCALPAVFPIRIRACTPNGDLKPNTDKLAT
jgi:Lipase maturation factor